MMDKSDPGKKSGSERPTLRAVEELHEEFGHLEGLKFGFGSCFLAVELKSKGYWWLILPVRSDGTDPVRIQGGTSSEPWIELTVPNIDAAIEFVAGQLRKIASDQGND
jgi:hypothetical protein